MSITAGRTIFEKSLSLTHYVFLPTVESGSREPEHSMGSTVAWRDKS
jgi:hypothetical protein